MRFLSQFQYQVGWLLVARLDDQRTLKLPGNLIITHLTIMTITIITILTILLSLLINTAAITHMTILTIMTITHHEWKLMWPGLHSSHNLWQFQTF